MKNIYITNKEKTQILMVDSDGDKDFININEDIFSEVGRLYTITEASRDRRFNFDNLNNHDLKDVDFWVKRD